MAAHRGEAMSTQVRFCDLCLRRVQTGDEQVDEGRHIHVVDEGIFLLICDRHEALWARVVAALRGSAEPQGAVVN